MKKNTASQSIGCQMVTAADGTAFAGTVTVYVTGDNGTQAAGTVGGGTCTHEGNGYHSYAPGQAETNYSHVAFTFIGTGAIPATVQVYPTELEANLASVLADTNELQTDWANGGRLDLILDARASQTSVDDVPTNAELATALGTADDATLAAIAALNNISTAQVQTSAAAALTAYDPPTKAELDSAVSPLATSASISALNNISSAQVTAAVPTAADIATAVWASVVETGYSALLSMRLILSALAGKLSGAATNTVTIRDVTDSKARITATVDADGNRTAVTLDGS